MNWKKCEAFPDYEVSECGHVRRATSGRGAIAGKLCKPWVDEEGRVSVSIRVEGKTKTVRVATLVCLAFVGPRPPGRYEVCHGDGNPGHNSFTNLRWDTSVGNKVDMIRHRTRLWGETANAAKLKWEEVAAIQRLWADGKMTQQEIADIFHVRQSAISKIVNGKRWRNPAEPDK